MYKILSAVFLVLWLAACDNNSGSVALIPANQPPSISTVADQSAAVNSAIGPLTITIADDRTAADDLGLVGSSDNADLIASVSVSGTGTERTVIITPVENAEGAAIITVAVIDGDNLQGEAVFNVSFALVPTTADVLVRDVFAQPANSEPLPISQFELTELDGNFDDLVDGT